MNLNTVRKNYDKLTPRERYAAILAATVRDDGAERAALLRTAPRLSYNVDHQLFTVMAFDHLGAFHVAQCLNLGIMLYMAQSVLAQLPGDPDGERRADEVMDQVEGVARQILELRAAWCKFCEGAGVDPDQALINQPGSGQQIPGGPANPDTLSFVVRLAEGICKDGPDPLEVQSLVETLNDTLQSLAFDTAR